MARILNFDASREEPDFTGMTREQLQCCLKDLRERISQLDAVEPEDMESEEYEVWGSRHEELEDLADELLDLLDEL